MVELKCEMCGGKLKLIDGFGHATCEYCGSTITLPDVNDKQREVENLLLNARKAVTEKNWVHIEKYYKLLQEKSLNNVMIETTFFRAVAKVMINDNLNYYQKKEELFNSLNVIEKYYNVTEHKEEVLKRISDFLFQMTFPTGKIAYTRYDSSRYNSNNSLAYMQTENVYNSLFYSVLAIFNYKLEQLAKSYSDTYLRSIISKHKQIITIVESERKKASKPVAIVAFVLFLIMAIISTSLYLYFTSLGFTDDVPFSIVVGLPWLCVIITGMIWYSQEKDENKKKFSITTKKVVNIIIYIWLVIATFIFIIGLINGGSIDGGLFFLFVCGIVPFSIIKKKFKIIWYGWIAITIILTIHDRVKGVAQGSALVDLFVVFVFGILPGWIIKGIIKLVKKFHS